MRRILVVSVFMLYVASSQAQTLHWQPANTPWGGQIKSLARMGGILYSNTGNGRLFRSDDSGRTWSFCGRSLMDSDRNAFAGRQISATGSSILAMTNNLYRSPDSAKSWFIIDSLESSSNSGRDVSLLVSSDSEIFAKIQSNLFRSIDGGITWTSLPFGGSAIVAKGPLVYVNTTNYGILRSTDYGNSWANIDTAPPLQDIGFLAITGTSVLAYANDSALYRSNDSGKSWAKSIPAIGDWMRSVCSNGKYLFAPTIYASRVYRSSDDGVSWSVSNNGLPDSSVNSLETIGNIVVAATKTGIYMTTDNGDKWNMSNKGISGWNLNDLNTKGDTIFAATLGLYRSTDFGESWNIYGNGLINKWPGFLFLDDPVWFTQDGYHVYRSFDNGVTWDTCAPVPSGPNGEIVVEGNNVIINGGDQFVTSTDLGNSWCCPDTGGGGFEFFANLHGLGNGLISDMTEVGFDISTDFGTTWLGRIGPNSQGANSLIMSGNLMWDGVNTGLYRSFDTGKDWDLINGEGAINTLASRGNMLFAGSQGDGVSLSTDSGVNWNYENNGLPSLNISKLVIAQSQIYALLSDGELYRAQFAGSSVSTTAVVLPRFNIFPNPLSSEAVIFYSIGNSSEVTIILLDPLGREVSRPIESQWQDAGEHEATINAADLVSGIYECRLSTGGSEAVTRIVVLK